MAWCRRCSCESPILASLCVCLGILCDAICSRCPGTPRYARFPCHWMGRGCLTLRRASSRGHTPPHPTTPLDCGPEAGQQCDIITDEIIAIERFADHIRLPQRAGAKPMVQPLPLHAQMARQAVDRPHPVNLVG